MLSCNVVVSAGDVPIWQTHQLGSPRLISQYTSHAPAPPPANPPILAFRAPVPGTYSYSVPPWDNEADELSLNVTGCTLEVRRANLQRNGCSTATAAPSWLRPALPALC